MKVKDFFFDRAIVKDAISDAERRNLRMIGAFIRRRARTKILRRRKRSSAPGSPPSIHSRDKRASLRNILFGYDPRRHSVIIGPVKLSGVVDNTDTLGKTVPELLEFGGTALIEEVQSRTSGPEDPWYPRDPNKPVLPWQRSRKRPARYRGNPFMSLALEQEIDAGTITDVWRASIG
ncbi:MAG TPA: hypothetical protein DDW52_30455 [Planctomycetaceae bacterium]|nr:hypothetical protein [Planctomycetaceae bacterium]